MCCPSIKTFHLVISSTLNNFQPTQPTAMVGKNCVAIASDLRFGINQQQTTAVDMKKIHKIHDHLYVGLSGLATDQMTLAQKFKFRCVCVGLSQIQTLFDATYGVQSASTTHYPTFPNPTL
jgi:20S proteasome subunit beta 3